MDFLEFTYQSAIKDYRNALYFNQFKKNPPVTAFYGLFFLVGLGILAVWAADPASITAFQLFSAIVIVLYPLLLIISIEYSIKKLVGTKNPETIKRIEADDNTLTVYDLNDASAVNYEWSLFYRAYETKKYFFYYTNTRNIIIIPKAGMDADAAAEFRAIAMDKLGNKYILRTKKGRG